MASDRDDYPHRRYNPLTGDWILVSPHRTKRPWDGQVETAAEIPLPRFDEKCYLCPGNSRAGGARNPEYRDTFVFTNDFPALLPTPPAAPTGDADTLLRHEPERGVCRVLCYSPRHDLTFATMDSEQVLPVIDAWVDEYVEIGARPDIGYVQIFENRGLLMGCSNPHPHGQIWATASVPTVVTREDDNQRAYRDAHRDCLLCTYLSKELALGERTLFANPSFVALVPYWAVWPFETMIIPRRHTGALDTLGTVEKRDLAAIMIELGICYDNLFETSFPYSMGIHQQPTDGADQPHWHCHIHYLPPLLRSASIRKHMVGYELLAAAQRDITPEEAAARLRALPRTHYRSAGNRR